MKITPSKLIRWAGLAAIVSGILFIAIQTIHPLDVLSSVTTPQWAIAHYMGIAMALFGLLGIAGIYARQVEEAGWLGLAGYLLFSLFYVLTLAFQFTEALISPLLATEAPKFVQGLLGIVTSTPSEISLGALPTVYLVTGLGGYLLGGVLFGIATLRAGILPRWAGALLAVGTVLPLVLSSLLPHPLDRVLAVPIGLALVWLGYALWSERREQAGGTLTRYGQPTASANRSRVRVYPQIRKTFEGLRCAIEFIAYTADLEGFTARQIKEPQMKVNVHEKGQAPKASLLDKLEKRTPRKRSASSSTSWTEWLTPAGLILLSVIPLIAGALRVTQIAGGPEIIPANARFSPPLPVVLHIVSATLFAILGAFQFVNSFRRRMPGWHRAAGRLLVLCGLLVGLSGLWMTLFYPRADGTGDLLYAFRLLFGSAMVVSIVLGFLAIRKRDFAGHRAWMMRGYAIGLTAGTQALTQLVGGLIIGPPTALSGALLIGAGWVINLAVAEWAIRRRSAPPARTASGVVAQLQ